MFVHLRQDLERVSDIPEPFCLLRAEGYSLVARMKMFVHLRQDLERVSVIPEPSHLQLLMLAEGRGI